VKTELPKYVGPLSRDKHLNALKTSKIKKSARHNINIELTKLRKCPSATNSYLHWRLRWVGGMWHAWKRAELCTGFWWESPKEDHLKDQGVDGRMGSKWTLG
jgi:hypothetical protein